MSESKTRTPKSMVVREGDIVRVVKPLFVERVGYPKSVRDYLEGLRAQHGPLLDSFFKTVLGHPQMYQSGNLGEGLVPSRTRKKVEQELAYSLAKKAGFGGRTRSIHWKPPMPELEGAFVRVESVRTAYTGVYYPSSGGRMGWDGWDEYEPAGLGDPKAHRIAAVRLYRPHALAPALFKRFRFAEQPLEIPVYHLQKFAPEELERELDRAS